MERMHVPFGDGPAAGRELRIEWLPRFWPIATVAIAEHDGQLVQLSDVTAYVAARLEWALYERRRIEDPAGWVMVDTGVRLKPSAEGATWKQPPTDLEEPDGR